MTYAPVPMTMPSVDCTAPYRPPRALVLDRIKQRFQRYDRHGQKCRERYNGAQRVIRPNEKRETAILWQRVQEYKNKKGGKFKTDSSRQKSNSETNEDSVYSALALSRLKRKLQLGGDEGPPGSNGFGENSGNDQQDPKKVKHDLPNVQRQAEYPLSSLSVQIVQNFGNEASKRIETTVNVQSNGNVPDSQSVSVNVGSKNIKQETMNDNRSGQSQMNQGNVNRNNSEPNDLGGLLDDEIMNDGDLNILLEWCQQLPEDVMDALLTSDTSQSPQMTSQSPQMTSPSHQMTSQSPQMTSQPQQMTSQTHAMTSQSQRLSSQACQMSQQSQQMTSPAQIMTSPQHHMSSPGQHMTSPPGLMTTQSVSSQMQQNARMLCKSEKVDNFQGFHGNMPDKGENMQRNPRMTQQNMSSNNMTQQNISANIMAQQSLRVTQNNNFAARISSQQNISLNMSASSGQPGGFHGNMRPSNNMTTNNNNMTSQHIHRLNQVAVNSQFAPHEPILEPPRLFHPPANSHDPQSQAGYYEHSQQLKQLAEKRWEMNSSASVNMTSDIRTSQTFPQYRSGEVPPMSQQLNMPNHPMSSAPGSQRLSHLDPNMYNRPPQQFMPNQRSGTVNTMMQQSMSLQQETMMKQRAQFQMQQNNYYNRMQDPPHPHQQHGIPTNPISSFPNNGSSHPSWNSRMPNWAGPPQIPPQNPMQRANSDLSQAGYLPELDLQSNVDLNILDEILSK